MSFPAPRTRLIASLALAGVGLVLFFGNHYRAWTRGLDLPLDLIGGSLFVAAVWFFVDAIHRVPRSEDEEAIAPQEWQSWVGLAFCSACLAAIAVHAPAFAAQVPITQNPDAGQAGRSIGVLFVSWAIVAYALRQRWAGRVHSDERDLQIANRASSWGRLAITVVVVGFAVTLGFSPTDRLAGYSYPWMAQLLMATLVFGVWVDCAVCALMYWRDRQASEDA